jgi:hypothetical protein
MKKKMKKIRKILKVEGLYIKRMKGRKNLSDQKLQVKLAPNLQELIQLYKTKQKMLI